MYNNDNDKPKIKYVVVDKTLRELEKFAKISSSYQEGIYTHDIVHEDMDEIQKNIQLQNKWSARVGNNIRFNADALYERARHIMYEELNNGIRENLTAVLKEKLMDTPIRAVVTTYERSDGRSGAECSIEYGERNEVDTYIENEVAMDEALKKVRIKAYNWQREDKENESYIRVENIEVSVYTYSYQSASDEVDKIIRRFLREGFTYCMKNDKVIVPEEYIAKGEEGIKEWRELKASKNRANSMEKRMLRTSLREKKAEVLHQMQVLLWRLPCANDRDWTMPFIMIDGSGNKSRVQKLTNQIIGDKTDSELLAMSSEDVEKEFKKFWKDKVMNIYNGIDGIDTMEK